MLADDDAVRLQKSGPRNFLQGRQRERERLPILVVIGRPHEDEVERAAGIGEVLRDVRANEAAAFKQLKLDQILPNLNLVAMLLFVTLFFFQSLLLFSFLSLFWFLLILVYLMIYLLYLVFHVFFVVLWFQLAL